MIVPVMEASRWDRLRVTLKRMAKRSSSSDFAARIDWYGGGDSAFEKGLIYHCAMIN